MAVQRKAMSKERTDDKADDLLGKAGAVMTLVAAVLCGAAVMEVELLGARVLSPWFGVSFFVWTSLITITLLSLAAGYFAGGRLADQRASLKTLSVLVGVSGLFLLAVPLCRAAVLKASAGLGIRAGALVAAGVLFGPSLVLLGTVTPFAVKLLLKDMKNTGRTVGKLSALSTFGSFAGTLATGFWIIPSFHVDQIASGTSILLLALASSLWMAAGGKKAAVLLVIPGFFFLKAPPLAEVVQPNGTKASVVCREESFYGQIAVVDYSYLDKRTREMLIDGIIQGGIDAVSGEPIYPFTYYLEQAALSHNPSARTALVIGLGPATMCNRLSKYGISGTVVEIDPKVAMLAEKYFNFVPAGFKVAIEDGRTFLERGGGNYDIVLLDAFSAENEPAHLLTVEAFESVKKKLNPGGVFAINLSGLAPGPGVDERVVDTVIRTLRSVFPRTFAYHSGFESAGGTISFTLGGMLPSGNVTTEGFVPLPVHPMAQPIVSGFMRNVYDVPSAQGPIYTDGWVPLESQGAEIKIKWREGEISSTPREILLN